MKVIGSNLRKCREEKKFSVEEVKNYLRIGSVQAIYKWEEGKNYPQADNLLALMELYDAGPGDITGRGKRKKHLSDVSVEDAGYILYGKGCGAEIICMKAGKRRREYLKKYYAELSGRRI